MTVFAKSLSPQWKKAFDEFEAMSSFEVMSLFDGVDVSEMTPQEVWDANIAWLQGLVDDVCNISTPDEGSDL